MLLNVALAAHLWLRPARSRTTLEPSTSVEIQKSVGGRAATAVANSSTDAPKTLEPDVAPLRWSDLESTDYRQYIANLRAAGCPEGVIRDIITSDLNQVFVKRAREIRPPEARKYWQKSTNERPTPKQMEQLAALAKEQSEVLKDLLGVRISNQNLIDLVYLQLHGSEQQLLLLPEEKREAALKALGESDIESKEAKLHSQTSYLGRDEQKLFNEKLKVLAAVLTPGELEDFNIRNSPAASSLRSQVRYLNLTPDEFGRLLSAVESKDEKQGLKEVVKTLFGDDRAREFEHVSSSFYINARAGAETEGVPLDRVDQAARLANDSAKAALAALNDRTISVSDRKARVQLLQSQAEGQITNLMGAKASQTMLRDFRSFFKQANTMIRP